MSFDCTGGRGDTKLFPGEGRAMTDRAQPIQVTGRDGPLGWIHPQEQPTDGVEVLVRLNNGQILMVPADLFIPQEDGTYFLPMSRDQFSGKEIETEADAESGMVIPVITEEAELTKQTVETGKVSIHKRVHSREELVDMETVHEQVEVERVPIGQVVDAPPDLRQEGDTLIIPVLEEVLVVEKRLVLKEEVRVKRVRRVNRDPQTVTLRSEEIQVERKE